LRGVFGGGVEVLDGSEHDKVWSLSSYRLGT
jgi:hypothetical protein